MTTAKLDNHVIERRQLLRVAVAAATLGISGCTAMKGIGSEDADEKKHDEAEVTPGEDLMQEHGVLERVLIIYDEAAARMKRNAKLDLLLVKKAAAVVQNFIEGYHEQLEERYVFPRLQAAGREVELISVLLHQHQRGREMTAAIIKATAAKGSKKHLGDYLVAFARMYRAHASREETVLFPAFRQVVGGKVYRELGESFEDEEQRRFGEAGFENTVAQVALIESELGIADLDKFTPPA